MTENQAIKAMEMLAKLYAEQEGFNNPLIEIRRKQTNEERD